MIVFNCPSCGTSIRVKAAFGGKKGKCPRCDGVLQVPSESVGAHSPDELSATPAAQASSLPPVPRPQPMQAEDVSFPSTSGELEVPEPGYNQEDELDLPFPSIGRTTLMLCPDCGTMISKRARGCPHCGCPTINPAFLQGCPDCETMVSKRARDCPHCGCPIVAPPPLWKSATMESSLLAKLASAIGILGVVFFAFGFDTTVDSLSGGRTHNIGLIAQQQVMVLVFTGLALRGAIPSRISVSRPGNSQ
jgi:hypothetical protein